MPPKVDVYKQSEGNISDIGWIQDAVYAVLNGEGGQIATGINIILVDDSYIQNLNLQYLGKNCPTDVIAFLLEDDVFGEVYISLDTARSQAEFYGASFYEEVARLVIHGMLHLLGYDDGTDEEKKQMTKKEDNYLNRVSCPV